MITRPSLFAVALLGCAVAFGGAPARAQASISFQGTVGAGTGIGGPPSRYRSGPSLDLSLAAGMHDYRTGGLVIGASVASQGLIARTDECLLVADNECADDFPIFGTIGLLAGWESASGGFRVLAGPAGFFSSEEHSTSTAGLSGRLDLATPDRRVAPVLSLRASLLPSYHGDAITLLSAGIGFRIR